MAKRPTRRASSTGVPVGASPYSYTASQPTVAGAPNVRYQRQELRDVLPLYDLIRDCISGSRAVKKAGDTYLPRPNASDQSPENHARYDAYLARAVFYNVTRRTVKALVGQIFMRDPQVDIPANLDVLKLDANGEAVSLEQIAKKAATFTIAYGRAGLHSDYPTTGSGVTAAQIASNDVRPIINAYEARSIVNWRKALRGAKQVYTLIVVGEPYTVHDDGFEAKTTEQFKVLRLVPAGTIVGRLQSAFPNGWDEEYGVAVETAVSSASDVYMIEVWRGDPGVNSQFTAYTMVEQYFPKDHAGNFLHEIPWQFVGAEENDDSVDHPPMADLAEINVAHYRNSADYEETSFLTGQPTPYVSGVTEEWNNNVLKGNIQLGSRGVIALPNGGTAGLLQAEANSVPYEAMQAKERQMVALGAKLVEQRAVQRTATEAQMEGTADTSILATIATNVSVAVQQAVKNCCAFTGDSPDAVTFILNTEFDLTRMDPAERQELIQEWIAGAITTSEMRANFRRGGVATLDDDEFKKEAAADAALRLEAQVTKTKALAAATPQPTQEPGAPAPKPGAPAPSK